MKIIANNFEPKEVFRIVREWTDLTQEQFSREAGKKSRAWARNIESGRNRYYFDDLLKIARKNGFTITIEKK